MSKLSADEMNTLLEAIQAGNLEDELPPMVGGGRHVRVYDFRSPDKFSKEQIRTLLMMHENFARTLTTSLSAYLRTMVQITPANIEQVTYHEFLKGVEDPGVLGVVQAGPLPSKALVEITPDVAFPMIDRLFGGPGTGVVRIRAMTEIETTAMRRVMGSVLYAWQEAWRNIVEVKPQLESLETSPLFAQFVAPGETVIYVSLQVQLGDHVGELKLCLPYLMLEPILPRLSAHNWFAREPQADSEESSAAMQQRLMDVEVPVAALLGSSRITVGDLLELQEGDVIRLDRTTEEAIEILVNDIQRFQGHPGRRGRRLAIEINEVMEEGGA